ncbi:MAG: inositol monophosphatase, monophosphatase [Candidatus Taylorbacteria bacterium]|nr:inositol monophosphatase, monophosphatase [Candidatus Taylorbacteria bacterium]
MPHWGKVEAIRQKDESAHNVVTKLDEEIEEYLTRELRAAYPEIPFVGEEGGGDRAAETFWLADPIDGTAHFIRGTAFCTTMLALIDRGQVVFGVIYDFVGDVMYHAELGKGAFKNGERMHVSGRPVESSYAAWESHLDKPENLERYLKLREISILFKTISSGYEHILVAQGQLEGRICFDPHGKDYDYAPGTLLISEAGGIVANIGKSEYDYRNTDYIAANPALFEKLTEGPDALFPISK